MSNLQRRRFLSLALALFFLLNGCALLTCDRYRSPDIELPEQWQGQVTEDLEGKEMTRFWESFQDPLLNQLIEQALKVNIDVRVAAVKVQQARLQAGIAKSDLDPTPTAATTSSAQKDLDTGQTTKSNALSVSLNYELDLWHKYSASTEVANLEAEATLADQQSAMLSLIGTTAELYWQIAYLNQQIDSNGGSLVYAEQSLALIQARYAAGEVSSAELIKNQQELLSRQQALEQNQQSLAEKRNALAVLLDQPPGQFGGNSTSLMETVLPKVKSGIPADLLQNRPDVQAAELRLRKTHEQITVTKRSYYPSFNLTGVLGTRSNQLMEFLQNPVATLGAELTLPFLQWNLTSLTIKVAETEYAEAVILFRQTLFTALLEVENALSTQALLQNQQRRLQRNQQLAERAMKLSAIRYQAGAVSRQDFLDGQEQVRVAQREVAENQLSNLQNMMQLYLSLGGGQTL